MLVAVFLVGLGSVALGRVGSFVSFLLSCGAALLPLRPLRPFCSFLPSFFFFLSSLLPRLGTLPLSLQTPKEHRHKSEMR
jgi:hypothetical protein